MHSHPPLCEAPREASTPSQPAPAGATDCHFHMFGSEDRYPLKPGRGYTPAAEARVAAYQRMAQTLGLERMVVVQPTVYALDHSCTFDTIEALGKHRTRAIALVDESTSEASLRDMDDRGVRGIRINAVTRNSIGLEHLKVLAGRIAKLGWHVQVFVSGADLPGMEETLLSLPVPVVLDHMAGIFTDRGADTLEFQTLLRLITSGKCWVKLCGYRYSVAGPPYADLIAPMQTMIEAAPEKCLWGTDWPHTSLFGPLMPDDGKLLDLLYEATPDPLRQQQILVDNPARLYGF